MNWRKWLYDKVTGLALADTYMAGTLDQTPATKPFIAIRLELESPNSPGLFQDATIWVHDSPGSYARIDDIISDLKSGIIGQISDAGAIGATWQGNSGDLVDDARGTIVKNVGLRLVGSP